MSVCEIYNEGFIPGQTSLAIVAKRKKEKVIALHFVDLSNQRAWATGGQGRVDTILRLPKRVHPHGDLDETPFVVFLVCVSFVAVRDLPVGIALHWGTAVVGDTSFGQSFGPATSSPPPTRTPLAMHMTSCPPP